MSVYVVCVCVGLELLYVFDVYLSSVKVSYYYAIRTLSP